MKNIFLILQICILITFAQVSSEFSSYGFNFVTDEYNDGLKGWSGSGIEDSSKISIYRQNDTLKNFALVLTPGSDTVTLSYDDHGYLALNPLAFTANIRLQFTTAPQGESFFNFRLTTGQKEIDLLFTESGIISRDTAGKETLLHALPELDQWLTYSIITDSLSETGTVMIENDSTTLFTFPLSLAESKPEIVLESSGDIAVEIDHIMIYSTPQKWWLGPSFSYGGETPEKYEGSTGDRQHFLELPNGERLGVNENGGGLITFTELYPGGPNLDPMPKFGSGSTKTLRGYFHTNRFNPVQGGVSHNNGGHLASVLATPGKVEVAPFPLHNFFQDDFVETEFLVFPSGDTLFEQFSATAADDDVYDEFGIDMRQELMSELDFSVTLEDVTPDGNISVVRHEAEWAYVRHPAQLLQFHETARGWQPEFDGVPGSDIDMGGMRHKFEIRLNKDLGYEWVYWRENGAWNSIQFLETSDSKGITITTDTPKEERILVFTTSDSPDDSNGVAFYYPESEFNQGSTTEKSRIDGEIKTSYDRRTTTSITADWRKSNWCRINLYSINNGLRAPGNGNPDNYESYNMEAYQLFGSPNEILNVVGEGKFEESAAVAQNTPNQVKNKNFKTITGANQVTLQFPQLTSGSVKLQLFTPSGRVVHNTSLSLASGTNQLSVHTEELAAGLYFYRLTTPDGAFSSQIVLK